MPQMIHFTYKSFSLLFWPRKSDGSHPHPRVSCCPKKEPMFVCQFIGEVSIYYEGFLQRQYRMCDDSRIFRGAVTPGKKYGYLGYIKKTGETLTVCLYEFVQSVIGITAHRGTNVKSGYRPRQAPVFRRAETYSMTWHEANNPDLMD